MLNQFGLLIIFFIIAVFTDYLAKRKAWHWSLVGPALIVIEAILFFIFHDLFVETLSVFHFIPFVIYFIVIGGIIVEGRRKYLKQQEQELQKMKARDIK